MSCPRQKSKISYTDEAVAESLASFVGLKNYIPNTARFPGQISYGPLSISLAMASTLIKILSTT